MARRAQYLDIADQLSSRWAKLAPGTLVASEHDVAAEFGINRLTAREAIRELERRMVVRREVGRGTFTAYRLDYVVELGGIASFHRTVGSLGVRADSRVLARRWVPAQGSAGRSDDCLVIERVSSIDGFVASSASEIFPEPVGRRVEPLLGDGVSVHETLTDLGFDPRRQSVTVALAIPDPPTADALGFSAAPHPTWLVSSVTGNGVGGETIHRSESWMRADMFNVTVRLESPVA